MTVFIDNILVDIYSGCKDSISEEEFIHIFELEQLDLYVEKSVHVFLRKLRTVSSMPNEGLRLIASINIISSFGRSLQKFPEDSIYYASYLIYLADKTDWMKAFLSDVGLRSGETSLFLYNKEKGD